MTYPPYTITSAILKRVANISEQLAARAALRGLAVDLLSPHLRRENRIRTIHASLAIENNTLSLEQVTDIINGKTVIGPPRDIQEAQCPPMKDWIHGNPTGWKICCRLTQYSCAILWKGPAVSALAA